MTGTNSKQQLAFFKLGMDASSTPNLGLTIQEALLNDCPNVHEEALLAVAWGEPVILEHQLLENSERLIRDKVSVDSATTDLLQVTRPSHDRRDGD